MPDIALSTSAFRDASKCLKRYEYRWVDKLVPIPRDQAPALRKGLWLHRTLELHDLGQDWRAELRNMAQWAVDHGVDDTAVQKLVLEVDTLTQDYLRYWSEHERLWSVVATEVPVSWEPTPGRRLTASVDVLKKNQYGDVWIWERKTTVEIPDSDWRCVDPQTMLQLVLLRAQGLDVKGVVFDYVCTRNPPTIRVKKDGRVYKGDDERQTTTSRLLDAIPAIRANWESDAEWSDPEAYINWLRAKVTNDDVFFARYPTLRADSHLVENMQDVADTVRAVATAQKAGHYRRAWDNFTCPRFCPYMKLCANEFQLGRRNEIIRAEQFTEATQEMWDQGRGAA